VLFAFVWSTVLAPTPGAAQEAVETAPPCPARFPIPSALAVLRCEERTWRCTCDEDGDLLREEQDLDFDGTPEFIVRYGYDGGRIERVGTDHDGDGVDEGALKLYYDGEGRLVLLTGDPLARGVTSTTAFYYDESGALGRVDTDSDGSGTPELFCTFSPPCPPPFDACAPLDCP
jgi:hypothetical protein